VNHNLQTEADEEGSKKLLWYMSINYHTSKTKYSY